MKKTYITVKQGYCRVPVINNFDLLYLLSFLKVRGKYYCKCELIIRMSVFEFFLYISKLATKCTKLL